MRLACLGLAGLPLIAAWVLASRPGSTRWGRGVVGGIDALALLLTPVLWNAPLGPEVFGLFLGALVMAALAFAAVSPDQDLETLCRLHLGASLSIVAVSTRGLSWSVPAILLFGMLVRKRRERLFQVLAPALAALAGVALVARTDGGGVGLLLLLVALPLFWLVVSREVLRSSTSGLVTRIAVSFILLAAVSSVLHRIAAGFPESAPVQAIQAVALGALALGSLGVLASTRVTTLLTALALARTGVVVFALLGGMHGIASSLLALAVSGAALLLVASALERVSTLEEVSNLASVPRRLVLTLGVLSASSFPPLPGFVTAFPLSSAVLDQGYSSSLIVAGALLFLLTLGSMRVVARAWQSEGARTLEGAAGLAPIGLAIAALFLFSIAPARLVEIARAAARGIY